MYIKSDSGLFRICAALSIAAALAVLAISWAGDRSALAATINVNTFADELNSDGDCSLREAIRASNLNAAVDACPAGAATTDTINLQAGTYTLSMSGTDDTAVAGDLDITGHLTIVGNGATIDGGAIDRAFDSYGLSFTTITISNLTMRNGSPGSNGGGIRIGNSDNVTLTNVTIDNNSALSGGGISTAGNLTVNSSTISNNHATSTTGGGIHVATSTGALTITNSTISGNDSNGSGAGIANYHNATVTNTTITNNTGVGSARGGGIYSNTVATTTLKNTIVAGNAAPVGPNCDGTITSNGHNLDSGTSCAFGGTGDISNSDPALGPLANNGGPTLTHALPAGSSAVNTGDNSGCPANDQRGVGRPQYSTCDIGAYEYDGAPPPTPSPTPPPTPTPTPSPTPSPTPIPTPTPTPTPSPSPTPAGQTPSPSPPPTPTPSPTPVGQTPSPTPAPTPTPTPTPVGQTPSPTPDPTPTPTPTPVGQTPSPSPIPTPTPTPTPVGQTPSPTSTTTSGPSPTGTSHPLTQGDVDCNGGVNSVDSLKILRHITDLPVAQTEPCPGIGQEIDTIWGDVDCSGNVTSVDALKILRFVAGLPIAQWEPCVGVGATIS